MLTEQAALQLIQDGLNFPPLTIRVRDDYGPTRLSGTQSPDWVVNIAWEGGGSRDFAVEYKSVSGLASVRSALLAAKAAAYGTELLPLVMTPFLRQESLDELLREKTSGLDLCGNGVIYAPGAWCIYRTGEKNRYPATATVASPFRGERSIVVRALLSRRSFQKQTEIVAYLAEFGISAPTVSRVLTALEEDLLVTRKPTIQIERPDIVLDRLRESYRPAKPRSRRRIRLELTDVVKERLDSNARDSKSWYALSVPTKYTLLPSSSDMRRILTADADALLRGIAFVDDDRFPTFEIEETDSRVPFFGRTFEDGLWWTSELQEYLTLTAGGKREQEAAVALRQRVLAQRNF